MEHHVRRLEHIPALVPNHWKMHQILETILVRLIDIIVIFTVLVNFDYGAINDKGTVIG